MSSISAIAITGMGCLCAPGNNLGECMVSLFKGDRESALPLRFHSSHFGSYPVFEVPDDLASLNHKGISDISPTASLVLDAAFEAVGDAGLDREVLHSKGDGLFLLTSYDESTLSP